MFAWVVQLSILFRNNLILHMDSTKLGRASQVCRCARAGGGWWFNRRVFVIEAHGQSGP